MRMLSTDCDEAVHELEAMCEHALEDVVERAREDLEGYD